MSAITAPSIAVSLNGERRELTEGQTVAGLLEQLGLDRRKVAVERNAEILLRARYGDTRLAEGDQLEIVHFIGGG